MVYLLASEVQQLLHNKFVVVLGDSVQRAVYKDLVLLLQKDCLLTTKQLRAKGELTFAKDTLVAGGLRDSLHNGIHYREVRQFCSDHHMVRFYFITRVYSEYMEDVLAELQSGEHAPDLVIINSCLWDLSRYGQSSWRSYLQNLDILFERMGQVLPESCLLVWNTAMPVGEKISGGFLPPDPPPWPIPLRDFLVEANFHSSTKANSHGFDVLDLHFHFRRCTWRHLQSDGVHWNEHAHRQLSFLLLAHVADAWGVDLPSRRGPARVPDARVAEGQPPAASPLRSPAPAPGPRRRSLLGSPPPHLRPRPLLSPQPPPPPPAPFPCYARDNYFSSDHFFQSDQFYFHSDVPSPPQAGLAFEADFASSPRPPAPGLPPPCYPQRAPVVYRGFPRYCARAPYEPWRGRPKWSKRPAPVRPELRPQ